MLLGCILYISPWKLLQYKLFQKNAAECYQPAGNNIFCTCFTEIEVAAGSNGSSNGGAAAIEEQGGFWWSRKSKAKKSTATKNRTSQRRQVTCPKPECGVSHASVFSTVLFTVLFRKLIVWSARAFGIKEIVLNKQSHPRMMYVMY